MSTPVQQKPVNLEMEVDIILTDEQRQSIADGIKQCEEGKGIPFEEVKKSLRFSKNYV